MQIRKIVGGFFLFLLLSAVVLSYAAGVIFVIGMAAPYWGSLRFLLFGLLAVVSLPFLYAILRLFTLRWRRLRIFISYKHLYRQEVQELKRKLEAQNVEVRYLTFEPRFHDNTIQEVQRLLRWMDAMVVIPDASRSSFVDAEIMGASLLKKPLVIFRHSPEQRLPNTAYSGYPVMDLDQQRKEGFKPLVNYLAFIRNHRRDYFPDLARVLERFIREFRDIIGDSVNGLYYIGFIVLMLILRRQISVQTFDWVLFIAGLLLVAFGLLIIMLSIYRRWRASRVARQTLISGEGTFPILAEALSLNWLPSDEKIFYAIERETLKIAEEQKEIKEGEQGNS